MAPISKVSSAPRKSAPSTQPTLAQVGQLAESAQSAAAKVNELKAQLKAADSAFKANPKNAVLGAKVQKLLEQTRAAMAAQEQADGALATAISSLIGKGTPREQAAALTRLLPRLEKELTAAKQAHSAAVAQLTKDVAAAQATNSNAALQKANASDVKADKAEKARDQLAAAKAAIESAISGKESAALEQARAANVPGSKDVMDLKDLASKSRDEQVRLVGAPVVGVTREAAVAADVERIRLAMNKSPESAARMLKLQLEGADPSQQAALLKAAAPMIKLMVTAAQGQPEVAGVLLDTVKQVNKLDRDALTRLIVDGTGTHFSPVMTQLHARLEKGEGLVEAVELRDAFKAAGKAGHAKSIDVPLTAKVNALKADFSAKGEKVKKLNADLARLVVGFGPLLPADKRQAAIEGFKAKHKEAYAAWEAAGARLAPAVQYALEGHDAKLEQLLPDFLATKAGEASMMQALAQQAAGKPSLLDRVPDLVKVSNEGAKLAGHVSTALAKGVGMQVINLTRDGKLVEAQALLHSLERNADLFGVGAEAMEKLTDRMSDVLKGGGQDAVKKLTQEFQDLDTSVPGFEGRRGQALKGLGLALSALAVVDKLGKFDELSIKDQIGTITEGFGVGVDGGLLAMEVFGASAARATLVLKGASAAAGAVAAVMDGISAVEAFREGKHAEGVASSASAVGGAILTTAAFTAAAGAQAVPVAGQVVGAVLVVGGTIAKWALESRAAQKAEDRIEADANAFLRAGGVSPRAADALDDLLRKDGRNIGPLLQQMAKELKMEPEAFFKHLVKDENAANLKKYVEWTKDFPVDSRGQFKRTGPKSIEVALIWLREDGLMPPGK